MIGFGWVRTYLGDVFLENICVLLCFGEICRKKDQKQQILGNVDVVMTITHTQIDGTITKGLLS